MTEDFTLKGVDLQCVRGYTTLFDNLQFEIDPSAAIRVNGANGRGKTSLLRIIAGLTQPDAGKILVNNRQIRDDPNFYNKQICYLGHKNGISDVLTPVENLVYLEQLEADPSWLSVSECLKIFNLSQISHLPCFRLSAGQKQRLTLSRVLRSTAPIWILDEPATSLDSYGVSLVTDMLEQHVKCGGTLIYTSHQDILDSQIKQSTIDL